MKHLLVAYFLLFSLKAAHCCSCESEGDEYYDFIALVRICNNEPIFSDSSYSGTYRSDFDIIELFKGPSLNHVFVWSGFSGLSWTSCDHHLEQNSEWIIRATFSSWDNDFVTGFCSYNISYKSSIGMSNWAYNSSEHTRNEYRQKYLDIAPWKFSGDTLIQRYPNGNIEFIEPYKDRKKHGTVKRFYPSGKIYRIENYKNDELHGIQKWFNEEGFIPSISHYKNGRRHGLWEDYFANGLPYRRKIYHQGKNELLEDYFFKTMVLEREEIYDFSTCTKETKRWSENGILEYHSISYHNGNFENWDFDFRGNLKSYSSWNAKKKERVTAKF